ncbi:hypothetical protein Sste5346_001149 [Sporothrix stenoceras]|uniref:FAD-binding FR-type domain-containing protein n=1 Tax=Sporothrix stenoceras TaxID=5173 RepID=A0ABR3ZPT5_9PEZI
MAETKESHEERTAHEPREAALHSVILSEITLVGSLVRLLRLQVPDGAPDIHFLPGQWVDAFCPGIAKAGGFTITSSPSKAVTSTDDRYIELAIKKSPENPAAAWLWQDADEVLGQTLRIRVGGSFVFPPPGAPASFATDRSARVVFVAGGVGINPLISMASHLGELNAAANDESEEGTGGPEVVFLYSVQADPEAAVKENEDGNDDDNDGNNEADRIPFLQRLASLFSREAVRGQLKVFLTGRGSSNGGGNDVLSCNEEDVPCLRRRITTADLDKAVLGDGSRSSGQNLDNVYVYVCGVPTMTDVFVEYLTGKDGPGLSTQQVLCEKWW